MRERASIFAFAVTLIFAAACGSPAPEDVGRVTNELAGGCRWDCPKCPPNKICPMIACMEVCPGKKTCDIMAKCAAGYTWSDKSCSCVRDKKADSACTTDADCRTFSDYCTGCDCRALSSGEADPVCDGPGVRCFADPCETFTAVCVNGSCSLQ